MKAYCPFCGIMVGESEREDDAFIHPVKECPADSLTWTAPEWNRRPNGAIQGQSSKDPKKTNAILYLLAYIRGKGQTDQTIESIAQEYAMWG